MNKARPLRDGDEIRVIAPSATLGPRDKRALERANERLAGCGYKVSFGANTEKSLYGGTDSVQDRLEDFQAAYTDDNVKAVMALTGGWSANELLPLIDWQLIRDNPKPLIGFSDITVLLNAIYARTGQSGLLGPNLHTLGREASWQYTLAGLDNVLRQKLPLRLKRSPLWSDRSKELRHTKPWNILQPGSAMARLIGGNLGTFYLLQGTPFQPKFETPFILATEDDDESGKLTGREFSRRFESILQLPGVRENIKGVLIGRFQPGSRFKEADLAEIIALKQLRNIPVVSGIDFGHTLPMLTLPIGGTVQLSAEPASIKLIIKDV